MTMNIIKGMQYGDAGYSQKERGDWYIATRALVDSTLEELGISVETGVTVLMCRKGFWNEKFNTYDIELFLWGTPDQLAHAQDKFKLQASVDRILDQPEQYWG